MKNYFMFTVSALAIAGMFTFSSCGDDDGPVDPCENTDLAIDLDGTESYTIVAVGSGGTSPYQFSIDGENFQDSGTFSDQAATDYTVTVKDANACTTTGTVSASDLESFTDSRDGRSYKIVTIGDQVWMGENLKVVSDTAYYCYENVAANCESDGALYTLYSGELACPKGWHLPSKAEWETLIEEAGGEEVGGKELREGGTTGFNAEMAGLRRDSDGKFFGKGEAVDYLTSGDGTEDTYIVTVLLEFDQVAAIANGTPRAGFCIRCLRD